MKTRGEHTISTMIFLNYLMRTRINNFEHPCRYLDRWDDGLKARDNDHVPSGTTMEFHLS